MDLRQKIEIRIEVWENIIFENLENIKKSNNDFVKKGLEQINYELRIKVKTLRDLI